MGVGVLHVPPALRERPKETSTVRQLPEIEHCHKQLSGCSSQTRGINYPEGLIVNTRSQDSSYINDDSVIRTQTQGYILISTAQVMLSLAFALRNATLKMFK